MTAVEPEPTCDAVAARCRCSKASGHVEAGDRVHECDPERCDGAWSGDENDESFRIVRLPLPAGPKAFEPWEDEL